MNIHRIYSLISPWFRRRRMARFRAQLQPSEQTRILDVGGYLWCWPEADCPAKVTCLNLDRHGGQLESPRRQMLQGDGCALMFGDRSFDIGYSNSVIEHLGTWERQRLFAAEIRRVGNALWVQTPARWFFIEPHLMAPFIHFLPKAWQRPMLRWFTLWGWITRPTPAQVEAFLAEVRLLTRAEMEALFPDCRIERERFLGLLTKSYIAVRTAAA